jgi:hypothetical protein
MRVRRLDPLGDMTFGAGALNFWRDQAEGVAQNVGSRLRLLRGEWFLDTSEGTPWQGGVLGTGTRQTADLVIRQRIVQTEGVDELVSYASSFNPDTRRFSVAATIRTIYGDAAVSETV